MKNKSANNICNNNTNIFHPNMILSSCPATNISMQKDIIYMYYLCHWIMLPLLILIMISYPKGSYKILVFGAKIYYAFRGKIQFSAPKQLTNPTKKCDACFRIY